MKRKLAWVPRNRVVAEAVVFVALAAVVPGALAQPQVSGKPAQAHVGADVAFPYYHAEDVVQGLYGLYLPPRARAFQAEAQRLSAALKTDCDKPGAAPALQAQWTQVLTAWAALSTPAAGPVLTRRSQRAIDFWPARPTLIEKALQRQPKTLADLETVGTPAKGIPALEWLLRRPLTAGTCAYAQLLSQGLEAEATGILQDMAPLAKAASTPPADSGEPGESAAESPVGPMFSEWVNQWLAGWERLRWGAIEQPLQKARTRGADAEFARADRASNLADWRAQWEALRVQASLTAEQHAAPPQPGQALIPMEALLRGKGQLVLADRWAQAIDRVGGRMATLTPSSGAAQLQTLTRDMKAVTTLYQNEVAAALDVPLGFSDADGD